MDLIEEYLVPVIIFIYPVVFIHLYRKIRHLQKDIKRNSYYTKGTVKEVSQITQQTERDYYQDIVVEYFYNGTTTRQLVRDIDLFYGCTNALGFMRKKGFKINEEIDIYVNRKTNKVGLIKEQHNMAFIGLMIFGSFLIIDLFFIALFIYLTFIQ